MRVGTESTNRRKTLASDDGRDERLHGPLNAGLGVLLPPAFAAVLMSASTVIVAVNAQLPGTLPKDLL